MFRKAVILVHGFSGGMFEMESLMTHLQLSKRFDVYAYTLPAHEKEVITKAKYTSWIKTSEEFVERILQNYKYVYIVGFSMGGVIASHLASKYDCRKLVLLAPAFDYLNFNQTKKDLLSVFEKSIEVDDVGYSFVFGKAIRVPIATVFEFQKLVKKYQGTPKQIPCETLIMHGEIDNIVPVSASENAYNLIGHSKKYLTLIEQVRHSVLTCKRKEDVAEYIEKFLKGGSLWKKNYKSKI